jgi:xanthine dehydrogenase accessory protein XdhC
MTGLAATLAQALAAGEPAVLVTVAEALGSTPREAGARMLVSARRTDGTIGGGRLEHEAVAAARRLIGSGAANYDMELPLGPAIGQCCGGHVGLRLERADADTLAELESSERAERDNLPAVCLFGAGHVGKAIAQALAPLPLRLTWIDSRAEEFPQNIPDSVTQAVAADPLHYVARAEPGTCFLILTHDHALDFALAAAALKCGDARYVGLIGSRTKRRKFERLYATSGGRPGDLAKLTCPIGAGLIRDKRPAVIAAMVAAELLIAIDRAANRVVPISAGDTRKEPACLIHPAGCGTCPDATADMPMRSAV